MTRFLTTSALATLLLSSFAVAQAPPRGWEASIGIFHQDAEEIAFDGGSYLHTDGDFGVIGGVGYRFNPKFDLQFEFDSASIGYVLTRQSATIPSTTQQLSSDYSLFTPYLEANYSFRDAKLTPFVSAGIGWAFIDTHIPTGNVFVGCWWDPWYGYLCAPFEETKTTDAFAYKLGVGARWNINDNYDLRLEYEKLWINLHNAKSTPDFDQFRLTFIVKYW